MVQTIEKPMISHHPYISVLLLMKFLWMGALVWGVAGCASMRGQSANVKDLDQIESQLRADPVPQVNQAEIREAAAQFEAEDDSLSAMTAEKFSKKVKLFFLTLVNLEPDQEAALKAFGEGVELFDQGNFDKAADKLWYAYFRWPDSPLQEDAIFLRAEAFFFDHQYAKAQREYERLLKKYDSTRYLDRVSPRLFAIGRYWEQLDQIHHYAALAPNFTDKTRPTFSTFGEAVKAYKTIALHDPNGLWAEHALMAAGNANYIRGEYVDAAQYYDDLIRSYPQSKHLLPACELNLSAKLLMYQGPEYDGKALEDADELAQRLISQFDRQLGERKEAILQTRNKIVEAKAERDMAFAEFYETKRLYGAARFYYLLVINEYPQTVASELAKERYDRIRDYRAEPPDYFAWLKKVFPEN
ncbi:MAG: outer membrane protein assembly factor BamD [Planctomycetia bacterium]|nr:outer membrane protein assembly factor BamD [Planctomycetia bacterium]